MVQLIYRISPESPGTREADRISEQEMWKQTSFNMTVRQEGEVVRHLGGRLKRGNLLG